VRVTPSRSNAPLSGFVATERYILDRVFTRTIVRGYYCDDVRVFV
jgi:hypothetical protein